MTRTRRPRRPLRSGGVSPPGRAARGGFSAPRGMGGVMRRGRRRGAAATGNAGRELPRGRRVRTAIVDGGAAVDLLEGRTRLGRSRRSRKFGRRGRIVGRADAPAILRRRQRGRFGQRGTMQDGALGKHRPVVNDGAVMKNLTVHGVSQRMRPAAATAQVGAMAPEVMNADRAAAHPTGGRAAMMRADPVAVVVARIVRVRRIVDPRMHIELAAPGAAGGVVVEEIEQPAAAHVLGTGSVHAAGHALRRKILARPAGARPARARSAGARSAGARPARAGVAGSARRRSDNVTRSAIAAVGRGATAARPYPAPQPRPSR